MNPSAFIERFLSESGSLVDRASAFLAVSPDHINQRTDAHDWTLGQLFDHLVKSDGASARKLIIALRQAPKSWESNVKFSFMGKFIMSGMTRPNIPVPKAMMPTENSYGSEIIQEYVDALSDLRAAISSTGVVDMRSIRLQSEAFSLLRFNGWDVLGICLGHGKRHLAQADAILAALKQG